MKKISQHNDQKKISYVKPDVLDLGPLTPIAGATDCTPLGNGISGNCSPTGTSPGLDCVGPGNSDLP